MIVKTSPKSSPKERTLTSEVTSVRSCPSPFFSFSFGEGVRRTDEVRGWGKVFKTLLLLSLFVFSCGKNDPAKVNKLSKTEVLKEVSTGVDAIYSDSAHVKARLITPKLVRFITDPIVEMPIGLKVNFYDKSLKINARLKADYGIRYLSKGITVVRKNVEVVNLKGDTVKTEELTWDENTDKVHSNKFVRVKTKDEIILAEGFESDISFSKYTFYKIRGTIAIRE
ncbi:MAG: LPS export ABC transporter periplasmic protein LptC [Bacteroidetes bacterium]|nr:LPS export ABC transporter periplasmic protein LptC [Bacteroidota bacterium]